jgi:IS5 family transposase
MRQSRIPQASIFEFYGAHETGQHLKAISSRLDAHPEILELAGAELIGDTTKATGRRGMSVDSIIRAALLKQMMGLSYDELSFYLADSFSYSSFARLSMPVSASALQANIGRLSATSWEQINGRVLSRAAEQGLEKGRVVRIDSTVTETDVHPPSDSTLLWDCVRVMVRLMGQLQDVLEPGLFRFRDRSRSAKQRAYRLDFARGANKTKLYKQLLEITEHTRADLYKGLSQQRGMQQALHYPKLAEQGWRILALTERVIDQTRRRVLDNEKVAAHEKVLSIFEPHTDLIVKGARDVQYGHKLNLTTGRSGLVLDVVIESGNPADSARLCPMIERQSAIYGRVPRQVAADGGYASQDNLARAKALGVKDVAFQKKRGLTIEAMVKSRWVYKKLSDFRAGIEGNISCLKRRYGLSRCTWKGEAGFAAYVWASTVAYNLMVLARLDTA